MAALASAVSSINNTKILMWVIAGIIIAALLYVSALQRVRDFAVLKALGSSTGTLLGSLALQAVIVALLAAAFAAIISNFMGGIFQQPVAIPNSAFIVADHAPSWWASFPAWLPCARPRVPTRQRRSAEPWHPSPPRT